ncbi:MAG: hypothetical protein H6Q73_164 [Firmicutes bacterium]|nr:hypothetical protein [Bacillota bacterium]
MLEKAVRPWATRLADAGTEELVAELKRRGDINELLKAVDRYDIAEHLAADYDVQEVVTRFDNDNWSVCVEGQKPIFGSGKAQVLIVLPQYDKAKVAV